VMTVLWDLDIFRGYRRFGEEFEVFGAGNDLSKSEADSQGNTRN
jgi:hypothetical protein